MDPASVQKHLKIHISATTNAIKMKLTAIIYLHETFYFGVKIGA